MAAKVGPFAYVTNVFSNGVSVIDTATGEVAASIPVAVTYSPTGVVVRPDGKFIYVANGGGVSVINASSNTVVGSAIA